MGCSNSTLGLGELPPDGHELIQNDKNMVIIEENLWVTVVKRNFKSRTEYCNYKKSSMPYGSLAVTDSRLVAYIMKKRLINIPFEEERILQIDFSVDATGKKKKLVIQLDASLFQPTWTGKLEYRFCTDQADLIYSKIENGILKAKLERQQQLPQQEIIPEAEIVFY